MYWKGTLTVSSFVYFFENSISQVKATLPPQEMITLAVATILHAFIHLGMSCVQKALKRRVSAIESACKTSWTDIECAKWWSKIMDWEKSLILHISIFFGLVFLRLIPTVSWKPCQMKALFISFLCVHSVLCSNRKYMASCWSAQCKKHYRLYYPIFVLRPHNLMAFQRPILQYWILAIPLLQCFGKNWPLIFRDVRQSCK